MKAKLLLAALFISSFFYGQFTENFESYTVGPMGNQNPALWNDWFGSFGTASWVKTINVDNTYANSGTKSGRINYPVDAILNLGNKTSGKWKLSFKMYIPTGKSAYINLQSDLTAQGGAAQTSEAFMANFRFNSIANNTVNGQPVTDFYSYDDKSNATTFSFPYDTWFDVELFFNKDNNSFRFKINGTVLNQIAMPFQHYDENYTLGGVDFFFSDQATGDFWIDDIVFAVDNTIPDTHLIPDLNFEQALVNLGLDTNGLTGDIYYADAANITSLDVSNLNIETLYGVEKFVNLTSLNASNNNLDKINLSTLTSLQTLNLSNNNLSTIDLSNNNTLVNLNISNNNLNGYVLNLTSKPNLTSINVSNTNLLGLNIANGNNTSITSFNATNCVNFSCIQVDDVTYANTQVSNNIWFKDGGTSFNTNCNIPTTYVVNDPNLEQLLVNLGIDTNGVTGDILVNDPLSITDLDISNNSITDVTGLERFVNLENLNASNNQLASINVSEFDNLQTLNVAQNQLTTLDITNSTALTSLTVNNNQLTTLDVTNNTALISLIVNNNQLTGLNVSNNTVLNTLIANDNQLNGSNVVFKTTNNNTIQLSASLETLNLNNNPLNSLDVTSLTNLVELQANNTNLSSLDVSNNALLQVLRVDTNNIPSIDITNNNALVVFWARYNRITTLNALNHSNLTQLLLTNQQNGFKLANLDISGATNLQYLYIDANAVNAIDITNHTNLIYFFAGWGNKFTSLSVNNHPNLLRLGIEGQDSAFSLTNLDVSGAPNLQRLGFSYNNVSSIDLSNNNNLTEIGARYTGLTGNLDLSTKTALTKLEIDFTSLSALNVANGNNANLTTFRADNNSNLTCIQVDDVTYADTQVTNGVWFKDAGTSFSADCFTILSNEDFISNEFKIYPNPVQSILHIDNALDLNKVEIYSITGKKVKSITNNLSEIDVYELESGIYFVKLFTNTGVLTRKVIKE